MDLIPDYIKEYPGFNWICSTGYRNGDKLSKSRLDDILREVDDENSIAFFEDYLDSINVFDKGDRRFIPQIHSLRSLKSVVIVGYSRDTYIKLTDSNINISYHRNGSEKAKQFHRDLRNPNIDYTSHCSMVETFIGHDNRSEKLIIESNQDELLKKLSIRALLLYFSITVGHLKDSMDYIKSLYNYKNKGEQLDMDEIMSNEEKYKLHKFYSYYFKDFISDKVNREVLKNEFPNNYVFLQCHSALITEYGYSIDEALKLMISSVYDDIDKILKL
jgi:hypothetical protein